MYIWARVLVGAQFATYICMETWKNIQYLISFQYWIPIQYQYQYSLILILNVDKSTGTRWSLRERKYLLSKPKGLIWASQQAKRGSACLLACPLDRKYIYIIFGIVIDDFGYFWVCKWSKQDYLGNHTSRVAYPSTRQTNTKLGRLCHYY